MQLTPPCSAPSCWWLTLSVWATSPLGIVVRHLFCGLFVFFFPPSYVALWNSKTPHRISFCERASCCLETSPSRLPPQNGTPSITLLSVSLLSFIFCPTSFWRKQAVFLGASGVLCQHSEVILWKFLSIQMIFWWICGGESGLPVLFLYHLRTTPWVSYCFNLSLIPPNYYPLSVMPYP